MARLTEMFLTVTLLLLLHNTQGQSEAYDAGEFVPMERLPWKTTAQQVVLPQDAVALRNCGRCTCCSKLICTSMTCCMESICQTGTGSCTDPKAVTCGCDSDKCVAGPP